MLTAVVLGVGIGGFLDGIVAHQLLGWHHLLSGWYPREDMTLMMVGDGLFHLLCPRSWASTTSAQGLVKWHMTWRFSLRARCSW